LFTIVAGAAASAVLNTTGSSSVLSLYASWSESATDCFGTSCSSESVWNIFLNATADGTDYCTWANTQAARAASTSAWANVGGQQGVSLNVDAFLAVLFARDCSLSALSSAADNLVQINGAAPSQPVGVNVVELSDVDNVTDTSFNNFLCWTEPSFCSSTSSVVVNVFVNNFCKSGCIASSATKPTCYGSSGCAENGQCVAHNKCACSNGYAGPRCATTSGCGTDGCFGRGVCGSSGVCACNDGYSGARCEVATSTTPPMPTSTPVPSSHGAEIPVSDDWLAPASILPKGLISHWGEISNSQVPLRSTGAQNARKPIPQPLDASKRVTIGGFVSANADYVAKQLAYDIRMTFPLHIALRIGNQASTVLRARLFVGDIGLSQDATTADDGNVTLNGPWRPMASWLGGDWPAWRLSGNATIPAFMMDALAAGRVYVLLTTADGSSVARAQLGRVDEIYASALMDSAMPDYNGFVLFFVDDTHSTSQYWVYYTTPLSYVERAAAVVQDTVEVIPMILGDYAVRQIGPLVLGDDTSLRYAVSKAGAYNLSPDTLAAMQGGELAFEADGVDANGAVSIIGGIV